jgi:hypothetical protein
VLVALHSFLKKDRPKAKRQRHGRASAAAAVSFGEKEGGRNEGRDAKGRNEEEVVAEA